MIRRPPRSTLDRSSAASDVYKRQILCTAPISFEDKKRYGKIITDFPAVELRFYEPLSADLKVRGRIKTLNNVTMLLIYSKVPSGKYHCLLYTSPSPRDRTRSRMPSSA